MVCGTNTSTFVHNGIDVTLHPIQPEPPKIGKRTNVTKNRFKYDTAIEAMQIDLEFEVELFLPPEGMVQSKCQTRGPHVEPK